MLRLQIWGVWSTPSLQLLYGPLSSGGVVPTWVDETQVGTTPG